MEVKIGEVMAWVNTNIWVALLLIPWVAYATLGRSTNTSTDSNSTCLSCPYLVVFGASMVDVGSNAAAMPFRSYSEFLPYGIDYFGKPAARFSNGRLFVDFLSQELGYGLLDPYLKSMGADFQYGVSFASSGSTASPNITVFTGSNSSGLFSLAVQIDQFRQFQSNVLIASQKERRRLKLPKSEVLGEGLVLMVSGLNDYAQLAINAQSYDADKIVDFVVANIESGIRSLVELGMKKFVVVNVIPLGCIPGIRASPGFANEVKDSRGCALKLNQLTYLHKARLEEMLLGKLASEYPNSINFHIFDVNALYLHAIDNPSLYGLKYPLDACCGYYNNGSIIFCGQSGYLNGQLYASNRCHDPSLYISWDAVHPVESFARYMADGILSGSFLTPPSITIQKTCTKTTKP